MKNKEELKREMKKKMNKEIDNYVEQMDVGFSKESFSIDEVESLWGNAIDGCLDTLREGTEQMLNSVNEKELISKKKDN